MAQTYDVLLSGTMRLTLTEHISGLAARIAHRMRHPGRVREAHAPQARGVAALRRAAGAGAGSSSWRLK
jgi:hypothetical protein